MPKLSWHKRRTAPPGVSVAPIVLAIVSLWIKAIGANCFSSDRLPGLLTLPEAREVILGGHPPPFGQEGFQRGAIDVVYSAGTANTMAIERVPNNGSVKSGVWDSAYTLHQLSFSACEGNGFSKQPKQK